MKTKWLLSMAMLLASGGTALAADAVKLQTRPSLDLAAARKIVDVAEHYAAAQGWTGSIAVVDTAGYPVLVEKLDGATAISADLAIRKGKTSALLGVPSVALEGRINQDHAALLSLGLTTLGGGEPIIVDKQVIGAVGVSTPVGAHDDPIALQGAKALSSTP